MTSRTSKAVRRRVRATALALAMALFCWSAPVQAAPIGVTYNMGVSLIAGIDTLGLDGASMSLTILFETTDTYADFGLGFAYIVATSDSLTISGSSGADGTFSSNNGIGFFPTFGGQFFSAGGEIANYTVGSVPLMLGFFTEAVPGILVGDLISASHFGTSPFPTDIGVGCNWCASNDTRLLVVTDSRYGVTNFSATAVPEPAALTLLGLGLVGFARARRRRP